MLTVSTFIEIGLDRLNVVTRSPFSSTAACGPGQYKGKVVTSVHYCTFLNGGKRDACLPCTGETIKPVAGDESSCPEDCGGDSKVANAEHTACGKCSL